MSLTKTNTLAYYAPNQVTAVGKVTNTLAYYTAIKITTVNENG